jgi:hypothetical protein
MHTTQHRSILSQPLAFWAASSSVENLPDTVRCTGVAPVDLWGKLTFFIPKKHSQQFLGNLHQNPQLSLLGCSVVTFESYQYKGVFESFRACTPEEEAFQQRYLDKFKEMIHMQGLPRDAVNGYYLQPSLALTFSVTEVYEQTPHKGTGHLLQENRNE